GHCQKFWAHSCSPVALLAHENSAPSLRAHSVRDRLGRGRQNKWHNRRREGERSDSRPCLYGLSVMIFLRRLWKIPALTTSLPCSRRLRNPDQLRRRERYRQNSSLKGAQGFDGSTWQPL